MIRRPDRWEAVISTRFWLGLLIGWSVIASWAALLGPEPGDYGSGEWTRLGTLFVLTVVAAHYDWDWYARRR